MSGIRHLACTALIAAIAVSPLPVRADSVLTTLISTDIRGLMPGMSPDVSTGTVLQNIYEGLVAWRDDGTVGMMLADQVATSPDGRTYSFTLRPDVRFQNGAPLTSREVVWTWQQFLDPKRNWPCRANFDGSRQIHLLSVEAVDPLHVSFTLEKPSGAFLSLMARSDCDSAGIAHPDSIDAQGNWSKAIGTGPFTLANWTHGQSVELAKFPGYVSRADKTDGLAGAKQAMVDRVRLLIIPDATTARIAIQSGQIDIYYDIDPNFAKDLASVPHVGVSAVPVAGTNNIVMQGLDPVLKDVRIRQAITKSLDSASMRESLMAGLVDTGGSLITPSSAYYGPVERREPAYDPEGARALLKEAGYRGQKLTILTNSQFGSMSDTAITAQAMLQAAGINADVETVEFSTQLQRYFKGNYQLMVWNTTPYLDPTFTFDRFIGDKAKQPEKMWDDPKAIALLQDLFAAGTPADRQPIFDSLQRLYVEQAPLVAWSARVTASAVRDNVHGFMPWAGEKPRFWNISVGG